ncbi:hypothetical protein M2352_003694 [Azospirillum fermentarium]|uniref:hypothetical protein n=1 Tax=Azospirillum fermentarium TaxID=1233114 RepID=UPI002226A6A7|nr:hypothetical protein [Azospirillum fermentarium]MCW2248060.1 hypothetical protein [Azospirillum fermentarium]
MKMIERVRPSRYRLKPAAPVQPGSMARLLMSGLVCLGLAGCGNGLSDSVIKNAVKDHLMSKGKVRHCLPQAKIKETNRPDRFVLAEEMFMNWEAEDGLIIGILLSGGYVNIYQGGYPGESVFKGAPAGKPGALYEPKSRDELWTIFEEIRRNGAVTVLTDKGKSAGVWKEGTACLTGQWLFQEVMNYTDPAPDKDGKIVSHINVKLKLDFTMVAAQPIENKYGNDLTKDFEIKGVKYSDGWRFYELVSG